MSWIRSVRLLIVNSDGLIAPDEKTYFHMVSQVVGEKGGRVESAYESDGGFVGLEFLDEVTPESIGKEAARRVKVLLSRSLLRRNDACRDRRRSRRNHDSRSGRPRARAGLGLQRTFGLPGQSRSASVASPLITVLDDGTMPAKRGSYAYDDEGTPCPKNVLIENGVLKGYMVDKISAMKFDLMATGNGRRERSATSPSCG